MQTKIHYTPLLHTTLTLSLLPFLTTILLLFLLPFPRQTCDALTLTTHTLLTLASFIFLSSVHSTVVLKQLLHPLSHSTLITSGLEKLLRFGIGTTWVGILTGFVLLGAVLVVDYEGPKAVGSIGMLGVACSVLVILVLGITHSTPPKSKPTEEKGKGKEEWEERAPKSPTTPGASTPTTSPTKVKETSQINKFNAILVVIGFAIQILSLIILLGVGGKAAMVRNGEFTQRAGCEESEWGDEVVVVDQNGGTHTGIVTVVGGDAIVRTGPPKGISMSGSNGKRTMTRTVSEGGTRGVEGVEVTVATTTSTTITVFVDSPA